MLQSQLEYAHWGVDWNKNMENFINFYPTPKELLRKITSTVQWWKLDGILDPEAGKGDIADYIKSERSNLVIDCIEINPELQATLKGKGYSVIHDDFLTFVPKYHYDLIIMNPPFDNGATHLLKALSIQKHGGRVICILNAETLRNPYTNERKVLVKELETLNASITYQKDEFKSAERVTSVEIAIVDVEIPQEEKASVIMENLKQKYYHDEEGKDITDLIDNDYLAAAVTRYNMEVDAGIQLIREYKALTPYIMSSMKTNPYTKPVLQMKLGEHDDLSESKYVRHIRNKYWSALFNDERFTGPMTGDMCTSYREKVNELEQYDFSIANIKELQIQMCGSLVSGIEGSIMKLFNDLSFRYSWSSEYDSNIHYYNGWATNKAWYVNKKVILPAHAWSDIWKKMEYRYSISEKFMDIEKAFNYLAGCPGADIHLGRILQVAENNQQTKNIPCKYFDLTFYKKGTVHITFKDMELLKKLNIFGGKGKNMLPPRYGKVPYEDMTTEEKAVVNEFDGGAEEYMKVYLQRDKFIVQNPMDLLSLPEAV